MNFQIFRRQEEDLMKKLFWLNSSSPPKASSAAFKVKAEEEEQEEAKPPVRFPICTALSPSSSKAKAVMAVAAKMGHNPEQKRLSLDSGYADSNQCSPRLVLCGFYVNLSFFCTPAALYANTTASDKRAV